MVGEDIGCSEGRAGWCGWDAHRGLGWWEGNRRQYEGLEVMVEGSSIGDVVARACGESVTGVDPSVPSSPT